MEALSSEQPLQTTRTGPDPVQGGEVYLLPTSFAQQRLWLVSRFQPKSSAYNLSGAFSLRGALDVGALQRSLDEIVRRHEILRTTFALLDGQPGQIVALDQPAPLTVVDFRGRPGTIEAERLLGSEADRPFDLERGPLFRTVLLQISSEEHVFLYVMHHIISDGWSEAVLIREIIVLYQSYCAGQPSPLPELAVQYGDFAQWQRDWLQGQVLDDVLGYWKAQLAGIPSVLELPTDRPRPAVFTYRGATVDIVVPLDLTNALREIGHGQRATLFMILVAAFGVLLARHSGQEDIVVGTPVANRNQVELEDLIGLFVNTLALRIDLSGSPMFLNLLARVRETVYAAQEHQDLPFERLIAELGLQRNLSFNPVFQVVVALESNPPERLALVGETTFQPVGSGKSTTAKFDLTLGLRESGHGLSGSLEYCTDLFDDATVRRMVNRFQILLAAIARDPARSIADLPLLEEGERQALLFESKWAPPANPSGRVASLHERFSVQARKTPRAIAVSCEGRSLTYEDLDRRSDVLARLLGSRIARRQKRVGICLERSLDMLVAILGTLKAGAAYVPLDPSYPQERLAYLLRNSGVAMLITARRLLNALPADGYVIELIDELKTAIMADAEGASGREIPGVAPESPAYVIYTSGSTGDPKGVEVSHQNVLRLFEATQDWFKFNESDVWTFFHSYAFDFSVWEIWGAWLYGGRLVVVPYWISRSPEQFQRLLREERVTVLSQIPSAFYALMRETLASEPAKEGPLALRYIVFGGDALEPRKLAPWFDRFGDERPCLVNMYGITETTVHVTYRPVTRRDLEATRTSPIGVPIPDLQVRVLDRFGQLAPLGVPGEMCIGGAGLAMGYLGRPALTAERFTPDPFGTQPGSRLYRSGDLARWTLDRELEYLGRIDHQVKVRGFRIEPGEIEAVLAQAPEVAEVAVVMRERGGEKFLAAYLVPNPGIEVRVEALRAFLKERLPEYMVPSAFISLDVLPLTPSGKLDRKALPDPDTARPELEVSYVAPRDEVEEVLAGAWSAVLGVERVGIHDNFFSLGGDSIRSVGALAQIREKGLDLSLQQLFQYPTIAALAAQVRTASQDEIAVHGEEISFGLVPAEDRERLPKDVEDAYPLTSLQAGMLFHREQELNTPVFHNINSWHLRLPFDSGAFERALFDLAKRHPILRTSFDLTSYSEPLQLVYRQAVFPLEVEDLRGMPDAEQVRVIAAYCENELLHPFELSARPQIRFHVHLRGDDIVQFTLTENHAILDGWSLHTLFDDLLRFYFAFLRGEPAPDLPVLRTRFRDFVALERQALLSPESRDFWDRKLSDCTVLKLPRWPDPQLDTRKRRVKRFDIPLANEVMAGLRRLAEQEAIPLKSVLLAAHFKVMGFLGGQRDVLTSISSHGRPETTDGLRICGLFLNTQPIRLDLAGGTCRQLARKVYEAELELLPHRRYPLAAIQKKWGRETLLETSFVYLNFHVLGHFARSGEVMTMDGGNTFVEETNFPVMTTFSHGLGGSGIILSLECDRTIFSDAQIESIRGYFLSVLEGMASAPEELHEAFCPLSKSELHGLRFEWNDSDCKYGDRLLLDLFEEQVATRPDSICLTGGDRSLTFAGLHRSAGRLARILRQKGIGPEGRVALCGERSLEMIVGILGTLQAGAAYVPIDVSHPRERLSFLIRDVGANIILTQERWRDALEGLAGTILCLDAPWPEGEQEPDRGPGIVPENLAYVIYTSGSTGNPKGVAVEHRQIMNYLNTVLEELAPPVGVNYALTSTLAADLGNTMIFLPLCSGGTLHVFPDAAVRDAGELARWLQERAIDGLKIVPSHLSALLDYPHPERLIPDRWLVLGGEGLESMWARRIQELAPGCRIFNEYGPTEATVAVALHELGRDGVPGRCATIPIGRPMGNSRLYVLDAHLQPVPIGVAGGLYIGGANLARGYFGRPDLTAKEFIPDALSGTPGERLYRTGDLARYLPEGQLEFLGRADQQVKIRGFRVDLREIEANLRQHPAVREAAVLAREHAGETRLVAYVTMAVQGQELTKGELERWLASRLPGYMIPAGILVLGSLPLTANGKLDVQALPVPERAGAGRAAERVPPADAVEVQLIHIWEQLLNVESVGVTDDFFDLGGDSLLAVRLVAQVRRQFGAKIPLAMLLQARTIRKLAAALRREAQPADQPGHLVPIQPHGDGLPLYFIHPGHGTVVCYLELARHLGPRQPFYGLQALDVDYDYEDDPYISIEAMAARYVAAIRERQPKGPYLLGGWSFGGLVAFEMAQQLLEQKEEVPRLFLLDCSVPVATAGMSKIGPSLMRAFLLIDHALDATRMAGKEPLALSPHDIMDLELNEQIDLLLDELAKRDAYPLDVDRDMLRRYFEVRVARIDAMNRYVLNSYPGHVTLLRTVEVLESIPLAEIQKIYENAVLLHPTYGWSEICREPLDVRIVPGHHESMIREPHVRTLAKELKICVDDVSRNFPTA
jgi:amino acid adenylation domain-containing protein